MPKPPIIDKLIFKEIDLKQELKNIDISSCETTDIFQKDKQLKQRDRIDEIIAWLYKASETKKEILYSFKDCIEKIENILKEK